MTQPTRGRPRDRTLPARRREEILEAAALLFAERGYSRADVQAVADAAGVGKGTVYRYFPTKKELFLAAADRGMRLLRLHVDEACKPASDALDQVEYAVCAYLEFYDAHPELVELLIQERAAFRDRQKPTYFEHRKANIGPWKDLYRDLIVCGRLRPIPVEQITEAISNIVYGTMFTNFFAGRTKPPSVQGREIVEVLFRGILSDTERRCRPLETASGENKA